MSDDDDNSSSSLDSRRSDGSPPPTPTPRLEKITKDGENHANEDSGSESDRSSKKSHNNSKLSGSRSGSSSSSGSGSGSSSESSDNSDEEKDDKSDENSAEEDGDRSRSSGSRSRSRSDSGSRSSRSQSGSESERDGDRQGDIKKLWQRDPDFYGIRRSSRNRSNSNSKPPKLVPQIRAPPAAKRPSAKKTSARKRKISTDDDDDSSDEEQTRSVRKRGTVVVSYKEEESDDDEMSLNEDETGQESQNGKPESEEQFETIERIMDIRMGKKGATGSATTIYAIEERGDPLDSLPEDAEPERQFFIKWVGWSHLHNTWESLETIQEMKAKGLKKLDNYCKKEDELSRWRSYASPEDTEYYECQLELQQELAKAYTKSERIITEHKAPDGQAEFFVKWECLPYADATWENGALIRKRNPEVIEIFKAREASNKTPTSKNFKSRPKFSQTKSQPDYMKGESQTLILRDYQLDGVNWLVHSWCKENSVILADEMGLGKTIQTICFLSYLFEACKLYGPYLIVVPLSTMAAWQKEFGQWAPHINVVTYLGDISSRDIIREYEWLFKSTRRIKFNAILTTYEIVLKDKAFLGAISWAMLMVDEAHRLKNGDSLLYKTLTDFDTNHRLLITGTPLQNSLKELWSLLHFIMPNKFDDWEFFEQEHDHAATKGYAKLHKQLEPYILRRVKKDVEKSLPAKVEQILRVEMTSLQKQYYKWILTKNYSALRRGVKGSVSSFINVVMELKKCCNHAGLVRPIEGPAPDTITSLIKGSGKLMLLDKLLVRLKETGHRVLIFSQMVRMLDIIAEYLQQRRFAFQRLDGSIKGDIRKQALDHFNAEGSIDFCFLLSTRAGGLGINLATADTVIIFDSDWNPQNDLQAQARAHRIGQKNQVNIYRLVTKNSVEEDIVERAKQKMVLDHLVIQRMDTTGRTVLDKGNKSGTPFNKEELTAILKFGAEELFKEDDNEGDDQCDIDEILRRAETHEEAARPGEELLSAFKVASFNVNEDEDELSNLPGSNATPDTKDWDQIIPEDLRKKVEDEEREKEMADLYLPPRSSRNAAANEGREVVTGESPPGKKGRKRRKHDESEDSDSDSGRPKKRGRPNKGFGREKIKGFTDSQIRKFVKSFKRFPHPLLRIEALAKDANLAEKSLAELKKLAETLMQRCNAAVEEYKANPAAVIKEESASNTPAQSEADGPGTPGADAKKKKPPKEKGPSFKLAGVMVNCRTLTSSIEELQPLGEFIPKDDTARKVWKFDLRTKTALFDSEWGPEEDTHLLVGVWEHGMGNWEAIRESDPLLKEKIFGDGDKKPQFKHACTRAEYLIKVIKKHLALTQPAAGRQAKGAKNKKPKADKKKDVGDVKLESGAVAVKEESADAPKEENTPKEGKSRVKKAPKKKKDPGPLHITASADPTPLNVLGDLDPRIFNECKEKMRPVKKALKSLDNPDTSLSEKEQVRHTRNCLIQIGDQIQTCLQNYKDPNEVKQWKSHLWYFVSKFTEYDPGKLHKLYKRATRKDDPDGVKSPKSKEKNKEKSKDKASKEKKGKRERESVKNLQENSNSSHSDLSKTSNTQYRERNRERDRDNRGAFGFGDNDRVPPTGESFSQSPNFRKGYHTVNGSYDTMPQYHGYRDRERAPGDPRDRMVNDPRAQTDPRDRAPGDPRGERAPGDPRDRDRGGHYSMSKSYYHPADRDRGPGNDRGRSWGSNKGRWSGGGGSGHYPSVRREAAAPIQPYYTGNQVPSVPTLPGQPIGYPAAQAPPHHLGRIAPPLTHEEWRKSDPKRLNNSTNNKSSSSTTSSGTRRDGYDKY